MPIQRSADIHWRSPRLHRTNIFFTSFFSLIQFHLSQKRGICNPANYLSINWWVIWCQRFFEWRFSSVSILLSNWFSNYNYKAASILPTSFTLLFTLVIRCTSHFREAFILSLWHAFSLQNRCSSSGCWHLGQPEMYGWLETCRCHLWHLTFPSYLDYVWNQSQEIHNVKTAR